MMTGLEIVNELRANYFEPFGFGVRVEVDASEFARVLVRVQRGDEVRRLFGLRFVDFPHAPPTLRFWLPERWNDPTFAFDFTTNGDPGTGTTTSNQGIPTMCVPYHSDYYRGGWHADSPWTTDQAEAHIADLVGNILRRA